MGIITRKNSPYLYVQFQFEGKTICRSTKTKNRKLARQLETKWKNEEHSRNVMGELESVTLHNAIDLYLKDLESRDAECPTLISQSKFILANVEYTVLLHRFTQQDYHKLVQAKKQTGAADGTINIMTSVIRGAIRTAESVGCKIPETIKWYKAKKKKPRLRFLSHEEENKILEELNPRIWRSGQKFFDKLSDQEKTLRCDNRDFFIMLLDTGCRYNEMAKITWDDINFDNKTIRIWRQKTRSETVLSMSERAYTTLKSKYANRLSDKWVFTDSSGNHRSYRSTYAMVKTFKVAGVEDATAHTLRHTFASRMAQNGLGLQEIAYLLGHSSISTTMIYSHLIPNEVTQKAASIMNDLNENAKEKSVEKARSKLQVVD